MNSIFLTGGTGFFGKSILSMVKRGFYRDCSFTILARQPGKFLEENPFFKELANVKFVQGDVRDFPFPVEKFDYIFHGAAPARLMPPGVEEDIILNGTRRVLQFAEVCNAKRLLFVSSGAVYGPQDPAVEKIPEDFPCSPVTEYGIAKYKAEKMCLDSGVESVIARCFAFTGPYLNREIHFAIGNFIRDCLAEKDIEIKGDGTPLRSYLYADDLVEWLFTILFEAPGGEIYNVGSDQALSILELAETVRSVLQTKNEIIIRQKAVEKKAPERYIPCIDKIRTQLQVSTPCSLQEAILKTILQKDGTSI
ncbi:MAG: NAD(P)-dependent oxidoreductase [Lentisphaeria bacterium]|nr:NAD(P)-dependent oxidoreductase [Lentisphaeria bacterium]